jgi:hypothetical protein
MRTSATALLLLVLSTPASHASVAAQAPHAVPGTPGITDMRATVTIRELRGVPDMLTTDTSSERAAPATSVQDLRLPEEGPTQRENRALPAVSYQLPAASPLPTVSFEGFHGGNASPDTMGAVGPDHVVSVVNHNFGIQSRTGKVIKVVDGDTFWDPLAKLYGVALDPFDPRILYDRFTGRFIFVSVSNPSPDVAKLLLAVSATSDPTGSWVEYGFDVDPTKDRWADYPSIGFNANWIVIQVNMFKMGASGFGVSRSDMYAFNKAQALAGATSLSFTKFTGVETESVNAFDIGGATWSPAVDADNASPNTMYFVQAWNQNAGTLRICKMAGPVGSETFTAGLQFPLSTESWTNVLPIMNNGFAPQANEAHTATHVTHIDNGDARMQNAVLRGGSIWCVQTIAVPTTHQQSGTTSNSIDHPSNHTAIQWWQVNASISTGNLTAPIQRGLIEDTAAVNCFNGNLTTPAQIVPCSESGTFYGYPSIAVNAAKDVLIGFSMFGADDWAAAAYAYHSHSDPLNATRKPVIMQIGRAPYFYVVSDGKTRWGDYSATLTDPANDRDFWVVQEHADLPGTSGSAVQGLWGTRWAKVEPPVTKRRSAGRAH